MAEESAAGFKDLTQAREWVLAFSHWYNHEHRHSGLNFPTPVQRHTGVEQAIMQKRKELYERAKAANPKRWSGKIRIGSWRLRYGSILNVRVMQLKARKNHDDFFGLL